MGEYEIIRSLTLGKLASMRNQGNSLAGLGFIFVVPALILCVGGVLQSLAGIRAFNNLINYDLLIFNPAILIGGLVIAIALNLLPVVRIKFQDGSLIGMIKLQGRLLNLGLLTFIGLMATIIFLYLLAENLQIFAHLPLNGGLA